jgi:hypothetical protein
VVSGFRDVLAAVGQACQGEPEARLLPVRFRLAPLLRYLCQQNVQALSIKTEPIVPSTEPAINMLISVMICGQSVADGLAVPWLPVVKRAVQINIGIVIDSSIEVCSDVTPSGTLK